MKKIKVTAKAPKVNKEATIEVNFPENTTEAVELHGEAPCISNINAAATIKVQAAMRAGLSSEPPKSVEEIQKALENYKLGVVTRSKKDPVEALLAREMDDDATLALIQKLKAKLNAKKQGQGSVTKNSQPGS